MSTKRTRLTTLAFVAFILAIVACTCGPVAQITEVAQEAQDLAEEAQDVAPTLASAATLAAQAEAAQESLEGSSDGGSDGGGGSADLSGVCDVLTDDEVGAAFGKTVLDSGAADDGSEGITCNYSFSEGGGFFLTVQSGDTVEAAEFVYTTLTAFTSSVGEEVTASNLDAALYIADGTTLFARSGEYIFIAIGDGEESSQQAIVDLTSSVAGRLE